MTRQSDITWNSLSYELKVLIEQRLGEPMAKDIAAMKRGTSNLDDAIAFCLLYDIKKMRDNAINLGIVHRLFPEIWPSQPVEEPIFLDWDGIGAGYNWFAVDKDGRGEFYTNEPKLDLENNQWRCRRGSSKTHPQHFPAPDWTMCLTKRPDVVAEPLPEEAHPLEAITAEQDQQPAEIEQEKGFFVRFQHSMPAEQIQEVVTLIDDLSTVHDVRINTQASDLFKNELVLTMKVSQRVLFKFAMDFGMIMSKKFTLHDLDVE